MEGIENLLNRVEKQKFCSNAVNSSAFKGITALFWECVKTDFE
jgi:hypothetical protein